MEAIFIPVTELLIIGLLTETLLEVIKQTAPKKLSEAGIKMTSLAIGIGLAIMLHVSIFTGVPQHVTIVGSVIGGAIASRGSNFIHSFMDAAASISRKVTDKK